MAMKRILVVAALAAIALAACGKNDPASKTGAAGVSGETASAGSSKGEQANAEKINAYTKGYNAMVGMFYGSTNGLKNLLEEYKSQKIASMKSAGADTRLEVYLNTSMLRNSLGDLKEGLALPGDADTTKIDEVVNRFVTNGDALFKQATTLEGYLSSKKYLEDNLAEAKTMDPEIIRRWEQLNVDFDALESELDAIERAHRPVVIARLKADGDTTGVNITEGTYAANDLLALFDQASDFKDSEKVAKADALAKQIESNANSLKAELDAKPDAEKHSNDMSAYEDLTAFIGSYRQIKAGGSTNEFNEMVRHYNQVLDNKH